VVSDDRSGVVVWGSPDGKRRTADIYDGRSGRLVRALKAFPGNRHISRFDVNEVGYWGNVLWATWPACEGCPTRETWMFDAEGHNPVHLSWHEPAFAPHDDHLEIVYFPDDDGTVIVLDRRTGARVATYPVGYRGHLAHAATLFAAPGGQFVLALRYTASRVDPRGDDDHPKTTNFMVLDLDAARQGRSIVPFASLFPVCGADGGR
jgi:hypothetical protein